MTKQEVLDIGIKLTETLGRYPNSVELAREGVTRDTLRARLGGLEGLYVAIANSTEAVFDLQRTQFKPKSIGKAKRFVITTAVTGASVDNNFLKAIKLYCAKYEAKLLVLVSPVGNNFLIDPVLRDETIIVEDTALNSNISILGIKSGAKQADPVTGLPRIGQRNGSIICPSPKQRLKYVATGPSALPHALMSTGSLTSPNYVKSTSLVDKTSYVANHDHIMGAVIVELEDDKFYHFRQIQADATGSFNDLNVKITKNSISAVSPHIVWGDWHAGKTDKKLVEATVQLSNKIKSKTWVWHDVFDGNSISHHDQGKEATLARKANDKELMLSQELEQYASDIYNFSKHVNLVIVKSNHDEHLERYLNEARYVKHPHNHRLALDLAAAFIDGLNPLEFYTKRRYSNYKFNTVKWLKRDESYSVGGVELGAHGDKGANGSRGSINALENAYGEVVFGHSHTPQILRGASCVGTSTLPQPDYGDGPSSWMQTHSLVFDNGQRQLINFINGKFTTRKL